MSSGTRKEVTAVRVNMLNGSRLQGMQPGQYMVHDSLPALGSCTHPGELSSCTNLRELMHP